jgi:hypothetical protein
MSAALSQEDAALAFCDKLARPGGLEWWSVLSPGGHARGGTTSLVEGRILHGPGSAHGPTCSREPLPFQGGSCAWGHVGTWPRVANRTNENSLRTCGLGSHHLAALLLFSPTLNPARWAGLQTPQIPPTFGGISSWDTTSIIFELNREDFSSLAVQCLQISPTDFAKFVPI